MRFNYYPFDADSILRDALILRAFSIGTVQFGHSPGSAKPQEDAEKAVYLQELRWAQSFITDQLLFLAVRIRSMTQRLGLNKQQEDELLGSLPIDAISIFPDGKVDVRQWMQLFHKVIHAKKLEFIESEYVSSRDGKPDSPGVASPKNILGLIVVGGQGMNGEDWGFLMKLEPVVEHLPIVIKRLRARLLERASGDEFGPA